jgi:hypothetical protein
VLYVTCAAAVLLLAGGCFTIAGRPLLTSETFRREIQELKQQHKQDMDEQKKEILDSIGEKACWGVGVHV